MPSNTFSLVASKPLPPMAPNDLDYAAPSMPLPVAGVDVSNNILAGTGWNSQGAEDDAVSDSSRQREAGCMLRNQSLERLSKILEI